MERNNGNGLGRHGVAECVGAGRSQSKRNAEMSEMRAILMTVEAFDMWWLECTYAGHSITWRCAEGPWSTSRLQIEEAGVDMLKY